MNRRAILLLAATFLSAHLSAQACEPRSRRQVRIEGAVTAVQQDQIEIGVGRRSEALLLTERTRIVQRGSEIDASILKSGDQIIARGVRKRLPVSYFLIQMIITGLVQLENNMPFGFLSKSGDSNFPPLVRFEILFI